MCNQSLLILTTCSLITIRKV